MLDGFKGARAAGLLVTLLLAFAKTGDGDLKRKEGKKLSAMKKFQNFKDAYSKSIEYAEVFSLSDIVLTTVIRLIKG